MRARRGAASYHREVKQSSSTDKIPLLDILRCHYIRKHRGAASICTTRDRIMFFLPILPLAPSIREGSPFGRRLDALGRSRNGEKRSYRSSYDRPEGPPAKSHPPRSSEEQLSQLSRVDNIDG